MPSLVARETSETFLAGSAEKVLGMVARSVGVFALTGTSTALNLMPSELLPPTTWLTSPVLGSRAMVKSLKGIGRRTENEALVETGGYHPEPSSTLTPARCISSLGCWACAAAPPTMIVRAAPYASRRSAKRGMG